MKKNILNYKFIEKAGSIIAGGYFIIGLLFLNWSAIMIVFAYWLEELITIILTGSTLIILRFKGRNPVHLKAFFILFGMFFFVHSIFVMILAGIVSKSDPIGEKIFELFFYPIAGKSLYFDLSFKLEIGQIIILLFFTVLYGIYRTVIRKGQWREMDIGRYINRSFGAFIAPHFIIIFGVGAIIFTEIPGSLAIILILVKILIDMSSFGDKGGQIIKTRDEIGY